MANFNSSHFYKLQDSVCKLWVCYSNDHEDWDVMPFSLVETYQCFRGICYLCVHGRRTKCMEEWCRYEAGGPGLENWV